MPLEVPNLDNRRWVDLVEEARSLIPRVAPRWTDHNAHDPGMTFIELFAWLAEMQIYQLNRIGRKHRELFSQLAGVSRRARKPARVGVRVEGDLNPGRFMPAGTQLTPLEGSEIIFETETDLFLTQSRLLRVITDDGSSRVDQTEANAKPGIAFLAFGEHAREGAELRLAFDKFYPTLEPDIRLTANVVTEDLGGRCGSGDPFRQEEDDQQNTPTVKLIWEYQAGPDQWIQIEDVRDETAAFSQSGAIILSVPGAIPDPEHVWIRARIQQGYYDIEPRLRSISLNVLPCSQRETVRNELLRQSNGKPDQSFELAKKPILIPEPKPRSPIISSDVADWDLLASLLEKGHGALATQLRGNLATSSSNPLAGYERIKNLNAELELTGGPQLANRESEGNTRPAQGDAEFEHLIGRTPVVITVANEPWSLVQSFDKSGPKSKHYIFDVEKHCVEFGNGLNGQVPIAGQEVRALWYRVSNGRSGNVAKGLQWRFRNTGIPGVTLTNPEPATGGAEPEPLDEMELRTRALLSRPQRAVTLKDLELLALSTPNAFVGRARAITDCPVPASITLVAVPKVRPGRKGSPEPPSEPFLRKVERHLQGSRLICDSIRVVPPLYIEVNVSARLRLAKGAAVDTVLDRARTALDRFLKGELQPVDQSLAANRDSVRKASIQSPCPTRWPFGRSVFPSEVYAILDGITGVDFASNLVLSATRGDTAIKADKTGAIPIPRVGLVYAGSHDLTVEPNSGRNA
jgi:Baseplate J-like protein